MTEPSNAAIVKELWRRGEIELLLLHEGQLKILELYRNLKGSLIVLNISRQWGKTFLAVVIAVITALKKPGARIRIGAAFESDLTEFIEPAFEAVLESCPTRYRPRYIQHKKRYVFRNGSSIKLVGLDKRPNGLRGNTIDLIIIDEAGFVNRLSYLYESVIVPLKTHRPDAKILLQSTPPESPDHEFWDFAARAKKEKAYAVFTIDQNPMLTPDDIRRIEIDMGGRETSAFQREYLCKKIIDKSRAIVPEWDSDKYAIDFNTDEDPLYPFWHKYWALDIGVQVDKTVNLFGYYNLREAKLYIEHDLEIGGTITTTDLIETTLLEKQETIPAYKNPYRRIADNSHPLLLNDLAIRPASLAYAATDKAKIHEMVGEVRVWMRFGRVIVHPRCTELIGCLEGGLWNKQRTEFERSKVFGHYDALAALVYLIRNIDQWTDPIPSYITNPDRMPGVKLKTNLSPLGQDMKNLFSKRKI